MDEGKSALPGTINETAKMVQTLAWMTFSSTVDEARFTDHTITPQVTDLGGEGIPVQCDHSNDDDVKQLVQRVIRERGWQSDLS